MENKRRKIETSTKSGKVTTKKPKKNDKSINKAKDEETIVVQAPKDWKMEDKNKQDEAKKKAAEVLKKIRETASIKKTAGKSSADIAMKKMRETMLAKKKGTGKSTQKKYKVKRQVLNNHNLSESESD